MVRLAWLLPLLAACGTTTDDRPRTIDYVTEAVLAPTCGAANCHSSFAQQKGDVFDTVEASRRSLVVNGLISFDSVAYDPANPDQAALIIWITQTDPFGRGIGRMPYDRPMPFEDVKFLEDWIAAGAFGAQCDPGSNPGQPNAGLNCKADVVYTCDSDWNFAVAQEDCAATKHSCISGMCL